MAGQRTLRIALLALLLGAAGCLRFGYKEHEPLRDKPDAGGGDAGSGGAGKPAGSGGSAGSGGALDAGSGGSAGRKPRAGSGGSDSGTGDPEDAAVRDAASDASGDDEDAGTSDAGTPPPWCPSRSDVLFCNGFEDDEFGKWSYTIEDNGTAVQTNVRKVSGEAALHATTGQVGPNNQARKAMQALAKTKSGDLWMRYDYYVPSSVVVNSQFSAGVMSEITDPYAGFSLLVLPTRIDISSMSGFFQGTTAFPRDRWVCVELHVRVHPSDGRFEVYLDGALAVQSPATNSVPADGYSVAEVGIHYAQQGQGPVEVYVDDVAVARSRIPCK
ncbi:MAG TPA: hypothetical protein VJR89_23420 [Polyangiales bacterium]|nr:hypothetical protein [Polyangiales bacterium]